ncbi:MAG: class I SAM-dependent methyltransferase [Methylotenera sp.]|nr:class I SAM-dependent methyltransferase [Methylotenera sp.]MSP99574.1 class I SAM-dependent methyltransferase [Methylotenera sp.]
MTTLPTPSADAKKHSEQLALLIQHTIEKAGGWIDFSQFMHLALYAPRLGYYTAGNQKFSDSKKSGGDFVTAPEISPLFAQTIAQQIEQVLQEVDGDIFELGAGTGKLAADLLLTLTELNSLPTKYFILEVSDHLRQIQLETLQKRLAPDLMQRVEWLNALPVLFNGVVIGNEVLDAIPVHMAHAAAQGLCERGVAWHDGFVWQDQVMTPNNLRALATQQNLAEGYLTEFCPAASGLIASLATMLQRGIILMIDYGFSAREYYHPQRNQGTLMCHYQHYAHTEPLINVGLQDITAHVDFTSIAYAGLNNGLTVSGFCSQAQFLMNCGILERMSQVSPQDMARYTPLAAAAQKLLSPAEMGDLFKVIALSKNLDAPLIGFANGDKSHTL